MVTFTLPTSAIDLKRMAITNPDEAMKMAIAGIRFAEFNEEAREFRISRPIRTLENLERGTVTIEQ